MKGRILFLEGSLPESAWLLDISFINVVRVYFLSPSYLILSFLIIIDLFLFSNAAMISYLLKVIYACFIWVKLFLEIREIFFPHFRITPTAIRTFRAS